MSDDDGKRSDDQPQDADALKGQLEKVMTQLAEERAAREAAEAKFADAKKTRDAAKERERKELEEKGEYQKALALMQEKLEGYKDFDSLKAQKESADAIIEERRKELLDRLPEDKRDAFSDASIAELKRAISLIPDKQSTDVDRGKPKNGKADASAMTWDEIVKAGLADAFIAEHGAAAMTAKIREGQKRKG